MAGLGGEHQPVEEPATIARPLQEQPVLGRGEPDLTLMIGEATGRHGLALQPHGAPRRA